MRQYRVEERAPHALQESTLGLQWHKDYLCQIATRNLADAILRDFAVCETYDKEAKESRLRYDLVVMSRGEYHELCAKAATEREKARALSGKAVKEQIINLIMELRT